MCVLGAVFHGVRSYSKIALSCGNPRFRLSGRLNPLQVYQVRRLGLHRRGPRMR